jgi:hypothetical protein
MSDRPLAEVHEMESLEEVKKANRELAERINEETLKDPASPYAGKYVGIANGKVVVIADDVPSLYYQLKEIEPDHRRVFWIEASRDREKIEYIWSSW